MIHKFYKIGKSIEWNSTSFWHDIKSLPDGDIYVDVTDKKPSKTLEQLRLLYALLKLIADETGYTVEQAKVVIKKKREFYEDFEDKKTGEVIRRWKSFSNLNLDEATDWIKYLLDLCEALGIRVKCPNCSKSISAGEIIKDKETKKLYCKYCSKT